MGLIVAWIGANWFNLLQTVAIVGGLIYNGRSLLLDARIRRIGNLLSITEHHRSIWQQVFDRPSLLRVLDADAKLKAKPITQEERIFVNLIILHFTAVAAAIAGKVHKAPYGQDEDLKRFFSLPIPNKVWNDTKWVREPEIVDYIESLLAKKPVQRRRRQKIPKLLQWLRNPASLFC